MPVTLLRTECFYGAIRRSILSYHYLLLIIHCHVTRSLIDTGGGGGYWLIYTGGGGYWLKYEPLDILGFVCVPQLVYQ